MPIISSDAANLHSDLHPVDVDKLHASERCTEHGGHKFRVGCPKAFFVELIVVRQVCFRHYGEDISATDGNPAVEQAVAHTNRTSDYGRYAEACGGAGYGVERIGRPLQEAAGMK